MVTLNDDLHIELNQGGGPGRGGKPNQKRRNRDDYEDDYGSHKGMFWDILLCT